MKHTVRLLCYYAMSILLFGSCTKENESPIPKLKQASTLSDNIQLARKAFIEKKINSHFVTPLTGQLPLIWTPRWEYATQRVVLDTCTYVYVPLDPTALTWVGIKKYIIIKILYNHIEFNEATYFFKEKDNASASKGKEKTFFAAFTGTMWLENIETGKKTLFTYQHGNKITNSVPQAGNTASSGSASNRTSSCYTLITCYWTGICQSEPSGGTPTYGTTTYGYDSCNSPSDDGVGCSRIAWTRTGSNSQAYCGGDGSGPSSPGNPGNPGNPDGGDSGPALEDEAATNNSALFGPCAGLNNSWRPLINYVPPSSALTRLSNLTAQEKQAIFGNQIPPGPIPYDPTWQMQSLQNAGGLAINLDIFSVTMTELPVVNGSRLTLMQFQEYIRTHFNDFIESGQPHFMPHPAIPGESANWQNHNIGTIMSIDIADPGSVILSDYAPDHWTFSTIRDPYNNAHPVSGNRTFGVYGMDAYTGTDFFGFTYYNPASYTFYIQGADRVQYRPFEFFGSLLNGSTQPANAFQFEQGDKLWEGVMRKIAAFVNDNTPHTNVARATVLNPVKNRPYWDKVVEALQNHRPLSGVPCP